MWKHETGIASLATSNPKVFFAHFRRNLQLSRHVVSLKAHLGVIVKKPEAQAELINEFYDAFSTLTTGNLSLHCQFHP